MKINELWDGEKVMMTDDDLNNSGVWFMLLRKMDVGFLIWGTIVTNYFDYLFILENDENK